MATRAYIDGKDVVLFIKRVNKTPTPETVFRAVACLESNGFNGTREEKTVNNKCSAGWKDGIPGNGSWGFSGNGQAITDVTSGEANFQELAEIWAAGEVFEMKAANADGSYYRGGTAMITDWSEDAGPDDPLSFDTTISGLGAPVMVEPEA